MFYKGLILLVIGLTVVVSSIAATIALGGGLYWIIAGLGLVVGFILSLTGYIVLKGKDAISKLVDKRDELR